jgi:hypothetical protein
MVVAIVLQLQSHPHVTIIPAIAATARTIAHRIVVTQIVTITVANDIVTRIYARIIVAAVVVATVLRLRTAVYHFIVLSTVGASHLLLISRCGRRFNCARTVFDCHNVQDIAANFIQI